MKAPFSTHPAAMPAIGIVAGIVMWRYGTPWAVAMVLAIAGCVFMTLRHHYAALLFITTGIGWGLAYINEPPAPPGTALDGELHLLSGLITDVRQGTSSTSCRMTIDTIDHRPVSTFSALIYQLPGGKTTLPGYRATAIAALHPTTPWLDVPFETDMSTYYLCRGVTATAFAEEMEPDTRCNPAGAQYLFYRYRSRIVSLLAHSGINDSTFAVLSALLVGYDDEIPEDIRSGFRTAGVAHALALSGFHVGVIVLVISMALYPLRAFWRLRKFRFLLSIILIWFYAALTGFPPSVTRSVIMASVYLLSFAAGRSAYPFNSLCVAVLIIAACSPLSIFSPGLQLSVAAVAGILAFSRPLNPVPPRRHRLHMAAAACVVPLAAVLGTLPLTISYFHSLPLLFLIPNIAIALVMPVWMCGGILLLVISATGFDTSLLASALDTLTDIVTQGTDAIASLPMAEITNLHVAPAAILAATILIIAVAVAINMNTKHTFIYAGIACALFLISLPLNAGTDSENRTFLVRGTTATAIVQRKDASLYVLHTAGARGHEGERERLERRLSNYAEVNGVDSLIFITDYPSVTSSATTITIATSATKNDTVQRPHTGFLLIGKRFRGSPDHLLRIQSCDTVLIGSEVTRGRAATIMQAATRAGVPAIDLRHRLPVL